MDTSNQLLKQLNFQVRVIVEEYKNEWNNFCLLFYSENEENEEKL